MEFSPLTNGVHCARSAEATATSGGVPTKSTHILLELHGCNSATLNSAKYISELMHRASVEAGARMLAQTGHQFLPQGITVVCALAESHFSIHTWPEAGYAAADFFTCGLCKPERAIPILVSGLEAKRWDCVNVLRGIDASPSFLINVVESTGQM
jgi:S-adenosylmethionine decarboxylase proenzyme